MSPLQTCSSCWVRCHSKREGKNRLSASTGWPGVWGQRRCCVMSPVIAATVFVGEPGLFEAGVWWEAQQGCLLCRQGGDHQVWIPDHCRQVGARSWRRCTVVAGGPGCSEAPCWDPPCPGVICFQGRGWNIWEADRLGRSVSMPPSRSALPCNVGRPCRSWCRTGWRGPRPRCPGRCLERGGIHLTCLEVRGRSLNGATDEGGQKDESEEDKIKEIKTESKVHQCPFANRLLLEITLWPEEP